MASSASRTGASWSVQLATVPFGPLIAAVVTLLLFWLRAPQTFVHPQFWAEDGAIFFQQQMTMGQRALLVPYAGYLNIAPRLTAGVASWFSAVHSPALYAGASVAFTLWSAATVAAARMRFAWLLGAGLLLTPHTGEVIGTITNVQWLMAPALALIICVPEASTAFGRANQLAFCLIASFTGPFSICLAPLALWQGWRHRRQRHAMGLCIIVLAGAATQSIFLATAGSPPFAVFHPLSMVMALLERTIGQLATGHHGLSGLDGLQDLIVVLAAASVLRDRQSPFHLLFVFLVLFLGSVWVKFASIDFHVFDGVEAGDRYFFVPRLIILWAIASSLLSSKHLGTIALTLAAIAIITINTRQWTKPPLQIMPWKPSAQRIDRGEAVTVYINPITANGGWPVTVPARQ